MATFEETHPEHMPTVNRTWGSIDGLQSYTHYKGSKIVERWERDKDGNLVDVTARERAKQELEEAKKALNKLLEDDTECKA
jgi:hypothetical protein